MLDIGLYTLPAHLIRRLHQVSVSLFAQRMEAAGVDLTPVQYAALKAVQSHPMIDQATLAGAIAYDRTTIGGVIDRLEMKGLIRRELSSNDRRVRQLVLSPAGEDIIAHLKGFIADVQVALLAPLKETEREIFVRLLQKLTWENNEHSRAPLRPVAETSPRSKGAEPSDLRPASRAAEAGRARPDLAPGLVEGSVPGIDKHRRRAGRPARQNVKGA